jgi:predicted pyridoxine 5'-phosphate oxidase superfamily flavin-nucleotide-binding protein
MRRPPGHNGGMGSEYPGIEARLREFIAAQPVFFVATAPLAGDGHVNLSPKGRAGTLAVLDEHTVAYLDFGGSGAETIAHLRENGRVTLMWCAFAGPPKILRVYGRGEPVFRDDPRFGDLVARFDPAAAEGTGLRAVILVHVERVADSCGYAVPFLEYRGERTLLTQWLDRRGEDGFAVYCEGKPYLRASLDGLPALPLPLPPRPA